MAHVSCRWESSFANRVHDFNPGNHTPSRPKRREAQQRFDRAFDRAMMLLHNIIEILTWANADVGLMELVVPGNRQ